MLFVLGRNILQLSASYSGGVSGRAKIAWMTNKIELRKGGGMDGVEDIECPRSGVEICIN